VNYKQKEIDESLYKLHHEQGVPVSILAESLNTSRGAIYKRFKRFENPQEFFKSQREYDKEIRIKRILEKLSND